MTHELFMKRAISLAQRGAGHVAPNPMVGAVLVHDGRVIGEGWHAVYGGLHAEAACLASVAEADRGLIPEAVMYVTLEPCAHQGKQPPCAHRLVREGIRKVVIAAEDPFPDVNGRGISILEDAGIEVMTGVCREEARWLARVFMTRHEEGRPYIILKWAESADGFFGPVDGSRRQLSSPQSQALVHRWRSQHPAILVGFNTALADNPQLNTRAWSGPDPLRIVLDRRLELPDTQHIFDGRQETWIVNELRDETIGNLRYLQHGFDESLLPELLEHLMAAGKTSLFVEGGAKLLNSFIAARLWDEARVFRTPLSLGDGVDAPKLRGGALAATFPLGNDRLELFMHAGSRLPYVAGAEL
jgi:diaminohydroxyphosphoribosylaminopyrimidine deaminase/5-amino-6-(5-phosphoribosylamino)uracil reductase